MNSTTTSTTFSVLAQPRVLWILSLLLLAANRFLIGPAVGASAGEVTGNMVFVFIRVVVFFLLALLLTRVSGFRRFRALSAVGLLVAVEHIGFNLVMILSSFRSNPADYPQGLSGPLFGLFMSYMIGLPIILLIAFFGTALGSRK
jgi:hypothetical protein